MECYKIRSVQDDGNPGPDPDESQRPDPTIRPGIVYNIKCICGDFYIGETGRSLTTRMKEHKAACRLAAFERSAVAEHAWQAGHEIEWDDVKIQDTATDLQERKVKESVYIRLAPKGLKMNR